MLVIYVTEKDVERSINFICISALNIALMTLLSCFFVVTLIHYSIILFFQFMLFLLIRHRHIVQGKNQDNQVLA